MATIILRSIVLDIPDEINPSDSQIEEWLKLQFKLKPSINGANPLINVSLLDAFNSIGSIHYSKQNYTGDGATIRKRK